MPPKHDAGTATRHYRAFWQRRCRAAAAGAVLKPQGGNCAVLPLLAAAHPFSLAYSSSVTGSHHSLLQSLPGTSTAMWLNQLSALAPCQCLTLAGMVITVPGVRLTAGLPSSWYQPSPAVQTSSWPPPLAAWWMCQLLRHRCQKHSAAQIHVYPCTSYLLPPVFLCPCPVVLDAAALGYYVTAIFFQNSLSKKLPAQRLIIPCTGS